MRAATTESRRKSPAPAASRRVGANAAGAKTRVARAEPRKAGATAALEGPQALAEASIRATGSRVTQGRIQVLQVLQAAGRALTHHEIEALVEAAAAAPLDRVTVYRVLDWLTRAQIAHKIPGDDRVWRFTIAGEKHAHHHAHFQCTDCSQVICLDEGLPGTLRPRLPAGYRSVGVEVTVKGQCRECVRPAARRTRRQS